MGTYHTHPLDSTQAGKTLDDDSTFSETDIANMMDPGKRVSLLRAGKNTHMLARTKEFEKLMSDYKNPEDMSTDITNVYNQVYDRVLAGDRKNHTKALEAAVRATTATFHLAYDSGQGANLTRAGAPAK